MLCSGNGMCLSRIKRTGIYINNNLCKHKCIPINCPNHIVCCRNYPLHYKQTYGDLCLTCDMFFGEWQGGKGVLPIIENAECPVCLETVICVSQPKCDHYLCIECFRRCYYGKRLERPAFPHPCIEEEYLEDIENIKWIINYPSIYYYEQKFKLILAKEEEMFSEESNLRLCPLCRK